MRTLTLLLAVIFSISIYAEDDPYLLKNFKDTEEANAVAFSPDGTKIIVGYANGSAKIINIESGKTEVNVKDHWKGVLAVEMDPKGKYFITAGDNRIKVWSPEGELIYTLKKHTTTIFSADINADGRHMITGSISPAFKKWDVLKGEFLADITGHTGMVMAVRYNRDGSLMASGSSDHSLKVWNAETNEELFSMPSHGTEIYAVDFSPDGKMLASCSKDKTIRIYDLEKKELMTILEGHKNFVMDIEFAQDNLHLVSCSFDKEIRIWEIPTGKNIYSFIDHEGEITDIAFAPDGKSFASASHDKTVKIWSYNTDIFVDYYYSDEVIGEMEESGLFLPKQKSESKIEFQEREAKAVQFKKEIYTKYYERYLAELKESKLPGMGK